MTENKKISKEVADGIYDYLKKSNLEDQLSAVIDLLRKKQGDFIAHVFVPKKLSISERKKVQKLVYKLAKENPDRIEFEEDANLIDGLKIYYKDKLWDLSLSSMFKTAD